MIEDNFVILKHRGREEIGDHKIRVHGKTSQELVRLPMAKEKAPVVKGVAEGVFRSEGG